MSYFYVTDQILGKIMNCNFLISELPQQKYVIVNDGSSEACENKWVEIQLVKPEMATQGVILLEMFKNLISEACLSVKKSNFVVSTIT